MIQYALRNYVEISYLVINKKVLIDSFVRQFQLSNYEYKTDLDKIIEIARDYGMAIETNDRTISYEVFDDDLYRFSEYALYSFFYTHRYIFNDKTILLRWYLCKKFLWQNESINIDDISEDGGYSRSNLRDVIKASREYLSNYNIDIINRPHYGLNVSGNEYDIRRCLVSLYSYLDIRVVKSDDNDIMINSFSEENYQKLSAAVAEIIQSFGYGITSATRRLINMYLIVQNARIKSGFTASERISIDDDLFQAIINDQTLRQIAESILSYMTGNLNFGPYSDMEIQTLMVILANCGCFDEFIGQTVNRLYWQEKEEVANLIYAYLSDTCHLANPDRELFVYFDSAVNQIIASHHMNTLGFNGYRLQGRPGKIHEYVLLRKINEDITGLLADYYGYYVAVSQTERICEVMYYYIKLRDISYPKLKIGVGCRGNLYEQDLLVRTIEKEIDSSYYEFVESCNFINVMDDYERVKSQYDLIICDQKVKSDPEIVSLQTIGYNFSRLEYYIRLSRNLMYNIEKNGYTIETRDLDFNNVEQLRTLVSELAEKTGEDEEKLKMALLNSFDDGITRIVFVASDSVPFHMMLGKTAAKVQNNSKIERYVILIARVDEDNIQLINSLLHEIVYDEVLFDNVASEKTMKVINAHLNSIL